MGPQSRDLGQALCARLEGNVGAPWLRLPYARAFTSREGQRAGTGLGASGRDGRAQLGGLDGSCRRGPTARRALAAAVGAMSHGGEARGALRPRPFRAVRRSGGGLRPATAPPAGHPSVCRSHWLSRCASKRRGCFPRVPGFAGICHGSAFLPGDRNVQVTWESGPAAYGTPHARRMQLTKASKVTNVSEGSTRRWVRRRGSRLGWMGSRCQRTSFPERSRGGQRRIAAAAYPQMVAGPCPISPSCPGRGVPTAFWSAQTRLAGRCTGSARSTERTCGPAFTLARGSDEAS